MIDDRCREKLMMTFISKVEWSQLAPGAKRVRLGKAKRSHQAAVCYLNHWLQCSSHRDHGAGIADAQL